MVNTFFITQACPDIRRKLQKMEVFAGMNISHLLKVTVKVYSNCEENSEKKANKRMKEKANLQASLLAASPKTRV
jgi:adenylate kinase